MADTFIRLRDVLADAYSDRSRAAILATAAGIPLKRQPIDQPDMLTWWGHTLLLAWSEQRLVALLDTAAADPVATGYRDRLLELREAVAALQQQPAPDEAPSALPRVAPVLFDEGHGQADWNRSQPIISGGFQEAARIAEEVSGASCDRNHGKFSAEALAGRRALILPIGPNAAAALTGDELTALDAYIGAGNGLLVLSTYCGDAHHHANLNDLLRKYGLLCNPDTVMSRESTDEEISGATHKELGPTDRLVVEAVADDAPATPSGSATRKQLLAGVQSVAVLSACSVAAKRRSAVSVLRSRDGSWVCEPDPFEVLGYLQHYHRQFPHVESVLAVASSKDRVAAAGSWQMFEDRFMRHAASDNAALFRNLLTWLLGQA